MDPVGPLQSRDRISTLDLDTPNPNQSDFNNRCRALRTVRTQNEHKSNWRRVQLFGQVHILLASLMRRGINCVMHCVYLVETLTESVG